MKTKNQKQNQSELQSRIAQQSQSEKTSETTHTQARPAFPFVDLQQRDANRQLPTAQVLELLRNTKQPSGDLPSLFECAEVVGQWIWIHFDAPPPQPTRSALAQLGFHWNNVRQCWQHPCGQLRTRGQQEPREKYESYFPADRQPAIAA